MKFTTDGKIPYEKIILFLKSRMIHFVFMSKSNESFFMLNSVRINCYDDHMSIELIDKNVKKTEWFEHFYRDLLFEIGGKMYRSKL